MSDLVERLRDCAAGMEPHIEMREACRDAVAEIERLTAERDQLRAALAELVVIEDYPRLHGINEASATELQSRRPIAWQAARTALSIKG